MVELSRSPRRRLCIQRGSSMEIRSSQKTDIPRMLEIYAYAREFMASYGNPLQWGPSRWPPKELLEADVEKGLSYVCLHEGKIVGTFFFAVGEDVEPTYRVIYDGTWQDETPYGVIHRLAGDGSVKGIGAFCLNWAYHQCGHLRIDTHGDNIVMQNLVKKLGFVHCGTIYIVKDPYPRLAYEKSERTKI